MARNAGASGTSGSSGVPMQGQCFSIKGGCPTPRQQTNSIPCQPMRCAERGIGA